MDSNDTIFVHAIGGFFNCCGFQAVCKEIAVESDNLNYAVEEVARMANINVSPTIAFHMQTGEREA